MKKSKRKKLEKIHKKNAVEGYQAIYKCRLCGEMYNSTFTSNEILAIETTIDACLGIKNKETCAPTMQQVHNCKDGSLGVGDFQGRKKVKR